MVMYKIDRRGGGTGGSKNRILGQTLLFSFTVILIKKLTVVNFFNAT